MAFTWPAAATYAAIELGMAAHQRAVYGFVVVKHGIAAENAATPKNTPFNGFSAVEFGEKRHRSFLDEIK